MKKTTLIPTAALLAVGLIIVAASNVTFAPVNSETTAKAASPLAAYAHGAGKTMRRAEAGILTIQDR